MSLDSRYVDSTSLDQHEEDLKSLQVGTTITSDYGMFHKALASYLQLSTKSSKGENGNTVLPKKVFNALPEERRQGNYDLEDRLSPLRAALINNKVVAASRTDLLPGENLVNPFRRNDSIEDAIYLAEVAQKVADANRITPDLETPLNTEQITAAVRRLLNLGQEESAAQHPESSPDA